MARLKPEFLERAESFSHRMVDVADALGAQRRSARVIEQIIGAGTSTGANVWEASEAISRPDFCKTLGVAMKELSECRFWIRFIQRRNWLDATRLVPLEAEAVELLKVLGTIVSRSRKAPRG